jgi:hypothetical protein
VAMEGDAILQVRAAAGHGEGDGGDEGGHEDLDLDVLVVGAPGALVRSTLDRLALP